MTLALALTLLAVPPDRLAEVDRYVESLRIADRVPGVAVVVVEGGQVMHARGFGDACPGGPPVAPDTPFLLGSMSKLFTAILVMQLVEAGRVGLDDDARRHVPELRLAGDPVVTVRQLLHHTSGLPTRAPMADAEGDLAAHVRALAGVALVHPPGGPHLYSSANYQVLGRLVEHVGGRPFAALVEERVLSRLGPRSAGPPACGHRYLAGFPVRADLPIERGRQPTASLSASAVDLARVAAALLADGTPPTSTTTPILGPAAVGELLRPGPRGGAFAYAMGVRVGPVHGVPALHHGGILDHFRGKFVMLTEPKMAVVVLTNASSHLGRRTSHLMADGAAAILAGQPTPRPPGLPLRHVLGGAALALALALVDVAVKLLTLRRWGARLAASPPVGLTRAWLRLKLLFGLVLPVALAAGLPAAFALSWLELGRAAPDLVAGLLLLLPSSLALATLRARRWAEIARTSGPTPG